MMHWNLRCLSAVAVKYSKAGVNTVFQQYMAAFPESQTRAEELIHQSAITASLSGATRMIVKTPAEASDIPVLADNLRGISLAMSGAEAAGQRPRGTRRLTRREWPKSALSSGERSRQSLRAFYCVAVEASLKELSTAFAEAG